MVSEKKQLPAPNRYELETIVGRGGYGVVWLGRDVQTDEVVAIKRQPFDNSSTRSELCREVKALATLQHRNIVEFKEVYEDPGAFGCGHACIVTEACGGDLCDRVMEHGVIPELACKRICFQILHAVNYMHKRGYCHRDIKPENICLSGVSQDFVKIIDFGLCCKQGGEKIMTRQCGSPFYVAPEVLNKSYTKGSCDVWSIGVVLFVMLAGYTPFYGETDAETAQCVLSADVEFEGEEWEAVTNTAQDLISKLLVKNPAERITAAEALQHPWFEGLNLQVIHNCCAEEESTALGNVASAASVVHAALRWKRRASKSNQKSHERLPLLCNVANAAGVVHSALRWKNRALNKPGRPPLKRSTTKRPRPSCEARVMPSAPGGPTSGPEQHSSPTCVSDFGRRTKVPRVLPALGPQPKASDGFLKTLKALEVMDISA